MEEFDLCMAVSPRLPSLTAIPVDANIYDVLAVPQEEATAGVAIFQTQTRKGLLACASCVFISVCVILS